MTAMKTTFDDAGAPLASARSRAGAWQAARAALAVSVWAGLSACAAGAGPQAAAVATEGDGPGVLRVICATPIDRLPDERLALDLARASGLGVQRVQALGARTFAVSFSCTPDERCQQGLVKLQAARHVVHDVTVDGLRTRPRTPRAEESR